ncbi:DUF3237 domain-containing protein [Alteraurantiacibacter aquimixticola]|uniref:UPF0311 protein E5222_08330 n=1 Tax=Alteraurantiacibacter aquimixticola TaxID=2489173 RepID=A0A4T3EZS5_9SPHN|nr:DUF3237 domain-containing protein [Alteraurantiacibacter aquimixticola]TIX50282.1 DUF3237 domain-containing protein [Alteraurantiacibacter aquimixticola]
MQRIIIATAAALVLAAPASAQESARERIAEEYPELELVYVSRVNIGAPLTIGETARGNRRLIPITGGSFEGPEMRGEVLPMGWDWQLDRGDGCTQIIADYFLRTDDGAVINIVNAGTLCPPDADGNPRPARTSPVFEPPLGKYEWLGQGGFIGTIGFDPAASEPHVVITVYRAK